MTFFVGGNMMAILVMESRNPVTYQRREEFFPTCELFTTAALTLGFTVCVVLRCYVCFREQFIFHVTVIGMIVVVTIVILLLVASGLSLQLNNITTTTNPLTKAKTFLPSRGKKNKGIVLFVALFLICIGVSVAQAMLPQAFHVGSYLLIMNATVGIALPFTFNDFVDSSREQENDMNLPSVYVII